MKTGSKGKAIIKKWEMLKLKAYMCPAKRWTIGYGHTAGVKEGDTCTETQADEFLAQDLHDAEMAVNNASQRLNQNQFDALVSLVYNIGSGNFSRSPVRERVIKNHESALIAEAFLKHVNIRAAADGKDNDADGIIDEPGEVQKLTGLENRRKSEIALYFSKEA